MNNWIAVSRTEHANTYFWPRQGYAFAAKDQVVPVLIAELTKLLPHYALGFIQRGDSYQPVALTGLGGERNLYLNADGRWLASYVPSVLRGYPFALANAESGPQVLAIEQGSITDDESAQRLFNEEGQLTSGAQQTVDFLTECEKNRQLTSMACQALSQAGVIEAWPLQINRGEGQEPLKVQGLYRINEQALNQLDAETFSKLRSYGASALAYAQLFSMGQLSQLTERAEFHAKEQAAQQSAKSLDGLMGSGGDTFSFNFNN